MRHRDPHDNPPAKAATQAPIEASRSRSAICAHTAAGGCWSIALPGSATTGRRSKPIAGRMNRRCATYAPMQSAPDDRRRRAIGLERPTACGEPDRRVVGVMQAKPQSSAIANQQCLPRRELFAGCSVEEKIAARRFFDALLLSKHWNRGICPFYRGPIADFARRGPGVMRGTFRYLIDCSAMGAGEIITTAAVALDLHHTLTPCRFQPIGSVPDTHGYRKRIIHL
jgi:hypothetical protein